MENQYRISLYDDYNTPQNRIYLKKYFRPLYNDTKCLFVDLEKALEISGQFLLTAIHVAEIIGDYENDLYDIGETWTMSEFYYSHNIN